MLTLAFAAPSAFGHAVVVSSTPEARSVAAVAPLKVTVRFSEGVSLLGDADFSVVSGTGVLSTGGPPRAVPGDVRAIEVPLQPGLADGTYTARWAVVSDDAHAIVGASVFAIGRGPVGPPFLGSARGIGPSETGVWAVTARVFELIFLGGLVGMLGYRWLVWNRVRIPGAEAALVVRFGSDLFWTGFGLLATAAMVAEGYLLVVKSATILGTSVVGALRQPGEIARVLAETRFGSLAQFRASLLFGVFLIAIWQYMSEVGSGDELPRDPGPVGRAAQYVMAALAVGALSGIAAQGHASTGRAPLLAITTDVVHLVAAAIWITGIVMTLIVLWRLPRIAGRAGREAAGQALARFSTIALVAVSMTVVAGVARSLFQLARPEDLWEMAYGRSILIKVALLVPVAVLGLRHRRVVTALRARVRPNAATLALVRRSALIELALSLAIVVIASILVAQVPPRV